MECGQLPLMLYLLLHIFSAHTQESFKPVLTVSPDQPVILAGETVILRCDIQWINVTYTWACDSRDVYTSQNNDYIIRHVKVSHSCTYRCFGSMAQWPRFSYWSNPVTLRINQNLISVVSVKPRLQMTTGQTVTRSSDEYNSGLPVSEVSLSPLKLVSFLLAASPYVLVSIILGLKCYRAQMCANSYQTMDI